jgi:predicted adenylyl cyclase CyaB
MKQSKFEKWQHKRFEERLSFRKNELEQKFRIYEPEALRKKLRQMGAVKGSSGMEHNELFDMGGALQEKNQILRLRYHGKEEAWLTFKGPRMKDEFKKRLELETPIHFETMKQILVILGYRVVDTYRKQREEYIAGLAKVCLDYLPRIGWFCEIEGRGPEIRKMMQKLGLDESQREERSYRKLLRHSTPALT